MQSISRMQLLQIANEGSLTTTCKLGQLTACKERNSLYNSQFEAGSRRGSRTFFRRQVLLSRLSLVGALAYEPDGSDAHLFSKLCPGAYNDETLIEFLSELYEA